MRKIKQIRLTNITNSSSTQMLLLLNDTTTLNETILVGAFSPTTSYPENHFFPETSLNFSQNKSFLGILNELFRTKRNVDATLDPMELDFVLITSDKELLKLYLYYLALDTYGKVASFVKDIDNYELAKDLYKLPRELAKAFELGEIGESALQFFTGGTNILPNAFFATDERIYSNYLSMLLLPNLHRKTLTLDPSSSIENYLELLERVKSLMLVVVTEDSGSFHRLYKTFKKSTQKIVQKVIKGVKNSPPIYKNKYPLVNEPLLKDIKSGFISNASYLSPLFNLVSYRDDELILYNRTYNYWIVYENKKTSPQEEVHATS